MGKELTTLGLKLYFEMGNHDNNSVGHAVFTKKHGGAYSSFIYKNELFIILNSTESDRSISKKQFDFLDKLISNTDAIAASYDRMIYDLWGRVVFKEFLLLNPGVNSNSI